IPCSLRKIRNYVASLAYLMFRGMVQIYVPAFRHLPQRTIDYCKYQSDTGILPISVSNGLQQIPPGCRNVP
ncbi:MAG: hypothetical protein WC406_02290, partial [Methanoregula sp.]